MEKNERLMSLDALRGADMFFIMGGSGLIMALCAFFGAKDCWLAEQMTHVAWHGFRHHDTIFPLFLFLAGVSWPFSYASQVAKGRSLAAILRKMAFRVGALVFFGLATADFFAFKVESFRYDSVLAHIAVCWAGAALLSIFVKNWKTRLAVAGGLLVVHWAALFFFTAPDAAALLASTDPAVAKKVASYAAYGTDNFSFTGNIAGWIDRTFMPGRLYEGIFDPDGLFAKVSGIPLALMGVLAGELLRSKSFSGNRKALLLLAAGLGALVLTFCWMPWCPVNKKIWTSTFVLSSAAYAFFALALFYWIIDVLGWRRWAFFFRVIGMNAITIYLMMRFVQFRAISKFFFSGVAGLGSGSWPDVMLAVGQIAIEWFVLWWLYRKNTFLKV
jgi:predicted acyltransferase